MKRWSFRILVSLVVACVVRAPLALMLRYPHSHKPNVTPPSEADFIVDHFFDMPDVLVIIPFVMLLMIANFIWTDRQERTRRRRAGHCPGCNYNLRSEFDRGCPECGWNRMNTKAN